MLRERETGVGEAGLEHIITIVRLTRHDREFVDGVHTLCLREWPFALYRVTVLFIVHVVLRKLRRNTQRVPRNPSQQDV